MSSITAMEGFEPASNTTPTGLVAFCIAYVLVSFLLTIPLLIIRRRQETKREQDVLLGTEPETALIGEQEMVELNDAAATGESLTEKQLAATGLPEEPVLTDQYQDETLKQQDLPGNLSMPEIPSAGVHPDPFELSSNTIPRRNSENLQALAPDFVPGSIRPNASIPVSVVQSAATTTMLRRNDASGTSTDHRSRNFQSMVIDLTLRMGWTQQNSVRGRQRNRLIRRSAFAERQSHAVSEDESATSRSRAPSWTSRPGMRPPSHGMISDAASNVLEGEIIEGEADFYRQRYVQRSKQRDRRRRSASNTSDRSFMQPLPSDALSPEDAADANDPGRDNPFTFPSEPYIERPQQLSAIDPFSGFLGRCGCFLDLVNPDYETRRIVWLAVPAIGVSVSDPFLRLILIGSISHFIDDDSMIAFVLAIIFVRLTTEEMSAAITDAESTMIQIAMSEGGDSAFYLTGQYMQLALLMQIIVGVPIFLVWVFVMENVVGWLLSYTSPNIAHLAARYTKVVVIHYMVRACSRTFMIPFLMDGPAPFERIIELVGTVLTVVAIVVVLYVSQNDDERPTLLAVGWIQVVASIAKAVAKISYVVLKHAFVPYHHGFFGSFTLLNTQAVSTFLFTAFPLLLGSLIELREWEILVLFVQFLGPAEVVSWAMMGNVWEFFEASTAGLGEAGSVRVSFYLTENEPNLACLVSQKVIILAAIQSLSLGSILLMLGPNISVGLTTDPTLQEMLNSLVGMTALATFSMTFAQIYWSLVGAQGRFGLASGAILFCRYLIVYPLSAGFVFGFLYSELSVIGAIAVGYATAGFVLVYTIIRSDWNAVAHANTHQEGIAVEPEAEFHDNIGLEELNDSSDDSSLVI